MCGIIGYIGPKQAQPIIMNSLKRMEYRGYDSAGVAVLEDGKLEICRAAGKLDNLSEKLKNNSFKGQIGIGHTRWATHGAPNETNAHPHKAGKIALIHNGIIENFEDLKTKLEDKGVKFKSDTDTEVLAQLINWLYKETGDLEKAVYGALDRVRGAFGIVVICEDEPEKLITARRGSPIVVGRAKDEVFVASDPAALAGRADEVIYLDEDEVAILTTKSVEVTDLERVPKEKKAQELNLKIEEMQKQGFDHFLLKEIYEQPDAIREVLRGRLDKKTGTSHLGGLNIGDKFIRNIDRFLIVACGTAYYSGLLSKYLLEKMTGIPVDVEIGSEFRYRDPVLTKNTLAIIISQSGETADTLASLQELKQRGIRTLGIVNVIGSSVAREVDGGVYLHAGPEISVASTKAFTSMVLANMLVGLHIARHRGLPLTEGQEIIKALKSLPDEIEKALELNDEIKKMAKKLTKFDNALFLGRDTLYPTAMEGALKLKEVSYLHAEGYSSGEMKHGPIALIEPDFLVVNLIGKGPMLEKSISNLEEVKARNGSIVIITDEISLKGQDNTIFVETSSLWTQPLVMNIVQQLIAYHVAVARGADVDQPRNLAKSVTVE